MAKPRVRTRRDMIPAALIRDAMEEMLPIVTRLVSQESFTRVEGDLLHRGSRWSMQLEPYGCELILPPLPSDKEPE